MKTNPSVYWNDTYATFNKSYADTLYADISVIDTDTQKNASGYLYNDSTTIYLNETKLNSTIELWDNITGIPHATPSNDDTTHFSLADEIYDWAVSLFLQSIVGDTSPQLGGYLDANGNDIGSTSDEIENIYVGDTTRIYFGDDQDASVYYNGTNLIISG